MHTALQESNVHHHARASSHVAWMVLLGPSIDGATELPMISSLLPASVDHAFVAAFSDCTELEECMTWFTTWLIGYNGIGGNPHVIRSLGRSTHDLELAVIVTTREVK